MVLRRIEYKLKQRKAEGLFRDPPSIECREGASVRIDGRRILSFASNDYLGLSTSNDLRQRIARHFADYGGTSSASRLVSANFSLLNQVEQAYADYFGHEAAIFFPSGFQANLAVLSTLFEKGDTVLFDKHIHASSIHGLRLSGAKLAGYAHGNMRHLEKRLVKTREPITGVVTESLFSMDGDLLNVRELAELKTRHGFFCVVDEAHAIGVLGEKGRGIAEPAADMVVGTFGKALGLFGAFVLLPKMVKSYLLNFSAPLIFTTGLPEAHAAAAADVLAAIEKSEPQRTQLRRLTQYLKTLFKQNGIPINGDAHILSVPVGEAHAASRIARALFDRGIWVLTARYPTVPMGKAILRISVTASHAEEDIKRLAALLSEILDRKNQTLI